MALKWKLVPTARHKKCVNSDTLCGVYIGNGCRKCPKCKMVQPPPKKRKRGDNSGGERKKLREIANGDPNKVYHVGNLVNVFWERHKCWTSGRITGSEHPGLGPVEYIINIFNENQTDAFWTVKVCASHMKKIRKIKNIKKYSFEDNMQWFFDSYRQKKFQAIYKDYPHGFYDENTQNYINLKRMWTTQHFEKRMLGIIEDNPGVYSKYLKDFTPHEPELADEFKDLKKGDIIKYTKPSGTVTYMAEVNKILKHVNPKYSSVWLTFIDRKTGEKSNRCHVWEPHLNYNYFKYQIFYEENGCKRPYGVEQCQKLRKFLFEAFEDAKKADKQRIVKITTFKTPNYMYEFILHLQMINKDKFEISGSFQRNMETGVKRSIYIEKIKSPRKKELKHYKADIIRAIGKHDWTWMNSEDTKKELQNVQHPAGIRLLGCTKFNKPFTDLSAREKFYDDFNVEAYINRRYHGTHSNNLFSILHPLGGFAMAREANGKCYGHGIYFGKSPYWVYDNGYAPQGVRNLRCIIVADIITGKILNKSTDSHHRNACLTKGTSDIGYNDANNIDTSCVLNAEKFELSGGSSTRNIDVIWYDRCKTDINITHVLWYK